MRNLEFRISNLEIPAAFLQRMHGQLGEEFPAFEAIYNRPSTHGLRVNTLKLPPALFAEHAPFALTPIPWSPAGFYLADEARPGKHPFHAAGLYYLQDPHAQAVAEILDPQPGERVLDLAAAPGGKTTHIASRMQGQGLLAANEIKTKRIGHLAANLERWGVRNAAILNETPERLADFFGAFFDRVLVDAPCSGEGMFRKDYTARADWSEEMVLGCAARQTVILRHAARLVKPGGWLCYATCTFAPKEDEQMVAAFLKEHGDFEAAEWRVEMSDGTLASGALGGRFWPHTSMGEGHFVALMRRKRSAVGGQRSTINSRRSTSGRRSAVGGQQSAERALEAWQADNLTISLPTASLLGVRWYALPQGLPDLSGLRVLHPGWRLGEARKDRFEPAHSLAMGLQIHDAQRTLILPPDSAESAAFLRGETLNSAGEDGWTLVTISLGDSHPPAGAAAFPLGWGKRVRGVVKNHYPRGLATT